MSIGALFDDAQRAPHNHPSLARRLRKLEVKHRQRGQSDEFEDGVKMCVLKLLEVAKSEGAATRVVKFLARYLELGLDVDVNVNTGATHDDARQKQQQQQQQQQQQHKEDVEVESQRRRQQQREEENEEDSMMTDAPEPEMEYQEEDGGEESGVNDGNDNSNNAVANAVLVAILPHLCAKDKTVRYRAIQLVATILVSIDEIDDDLYKVVRHELIKRLRDRVPAIRLEAVLVLGPLVENEMESAEVTRLQQNQDGEGDDDEAEDSDYDDESNQASGLLDKLLDVLQNDTNADVRRALLVNLPITPHTLPYLMERARDKDANTRRAFYAKVGMQRLGDFRHLGMNMREKLLRWGLRDRDERVRKATARMFREKWIEDCARTSLLVADEDGEQETMKTNKLTGFYEARMPALLELLERIDVVNTGAEGGMAIDAMKEFWAGRPDYVDVIALDDDFWAGLRAESAFVARTWIDFCQHDQHHTDLLEEQMPEVTRFGFHLQKHLNTLTEKLAQNQQSNDSGEDDENEEEREDTTEQEFVVEQLLHIAHTLDYTDEIGRRKMFSLLRNSIAIPTLPEECTKLAIEALRLTCNSDAAGEKEFTSVVLEAIAEVHDTLSGDNDGNENDGVVGEEDSFVSARSEVSQSSTSSTSTAVAQSTTATKNKSSSMSTSRSKSQSSRLSNDPHRSEIQRIREILINLKCLSLAHAMLQNISGPIISDINLEGCLDSLVLPSVRSHDAPVRIKALSCLGLCCLIEPRLAVMNWSVFEHCLRRGDDQIKVLSLQVFCDVLLANQSKIVNATEQDEHDEQLERVKFDISPFLAAFDFVGSLEVQNVATASLAKLMVCGFYDCDGDNDDNSNNNNVDNGDDGTGEKEQQHDQQQQQQQQQREQSSSRGARSRNKRKEEFDQACRLAEERGVRGWDVLVKVRLAMGGGADGGGQ